MPRVKKVDRPIRVEVQIPTSIMSKVILELHSDLEGKVPLGKMSELVSRLFIKWLKDERGILS